MEASMIFGYHIFLHDKSANVMEDLEKLKKAMTLVQLGAPLLSIFMSSKKVLYVGVNIPSGWNENADSGPRITFDEQLRQTHQNNKMTWNDWFDTYHVLHNQEIKIEMDSIQIKCENETPCLFATADLITLKHLP